MRLHPVQFPQLGDEYDPRKMRVLVEELERLYTSLAANDDEVEEVTAAQLADVDDPINTRGKKFGKIVVDSTNDRMLYALGPAATDGWRVVDGSATVVPS